MRLIQYFEEFTGQNRYHLATGELVKLNRLHIHDGVLPYLEDALLQIDGGRNFIKQEIKFDHVIGVTHCVKTTDSDEVYYKTRPNRKKPSRMIDKEPSPCDTMTIILLKKKGFYQLLTAYIGYIAEPEPWDQRAFNKNSDPDRAKKLSVDFWNNHALIEESNKQDGFVELEKILLEDSGERVSYKYEEDLEELIERGSFYGDDWNYELVKMSPSKCHRNVTEFYKNFVKENSEDEIGLVTGWALSNGVWVQHSWIMLWYDDMLIETTEPRDLYYGIEKKYKDLDKFLYDNE